VGEATFVQAAGFLKVDGGDNPLDRTWVHPESYAVASQLLEKLELPIEQITVGKATDTFREHLSRHSRQSLAEDLGIGSLALDQLVEALERPGRDLRADLPPPVFRRDVVKLEDLEVGMQLRGTVLNVVDFGAFVDVGLSDSGLVHISQMSTNFVRDPHQLVAAGDQVTCWVASIDQQRRRVALSMLPPGTERPTKGEKPKRQRGPRRGKSAASTTAPASASASTPAGAAAGSAGPRGNARGKAGDGHKPRRPRKKFEPAKAQRRPQSGTFEKRAKRDVVPITKEMAEGKEAMRTFSDLLQFVQKKSGNND
jgi:uncharacterized protein